MANPDPTITFEVDLTLNMAENLGPNTNMSSQALLHPDRHQTGQDLAQADINQRGNHLSTWLPTGIAGNKALKHGDQFTLYGTQAIYVRDMYTGSSPQSGMSVLKVV